MLNLTFIETFVWAARLKSFTLAAERMNTSQAAISSRIASLEADLGIKLFTREHRAIRLTPAGLRALPQAEALVNAARRFQDETRGAEGMRGVVRMGVIDTISLTWLVDLVRTSKQMFPHVNIVVYGGTSLDMLEMLGSGQLDLGILMGPMLDQDFVNIELCSYACLWMAAPALGLSEGCVDLPKLLEFPIISFPRGSQPRDALDRYLAEVSTDNKVFYEANLSTMIRMAESGIGVATIPPAVTASELDRGALALINAEQPIPPMRFHAVHARAPETTLAPVIAELARDVALEFCRKSKPEWAWQRGVSPMGAAG